MNTIIEQILRKTNVKRQMINGHDAKNCPICQYCLENDYMILKSYEMNSAIIKSIVPEKLGIDNIKKAFDETYDLAIKIKKLKDNWSWKVATELIFELAEFNGLILAYKQAIKEINDLDDTERKALDSFFEGRIEFENKKLEEALEELLSLIIETYTFIKSGIKLAGSWQDFMPKFKIAFSNNKAA